MRKLGIDFYRREDVLLIAEELLGKLLVTNWDGITTSGRIVEVEAYAGTIDRASHAYGGRRTARNEVMWLDGGLSYVYLCYGIHHLFNVVTNKKDIPHAILVRALEPVEGIPVMLHRTGKAQVDHTLTRGPGNVSKAMGIHTNHSQYPLMGDELFIAEDDFKYSKKKIGKSPRIGVDYAGTHALWPYRMYVKGNENVSGKIWK